MDLSKDWDAKIRAQVKMMIAKDPRFAGKDYNEVSAAVDKATTDAIKDRAY